MGENTILKGAGQGTRRNCSPSTTDSFSKHHEHSVDDAPPHHGPGEHLADGNGEPNRGLCCQPVVRRVKARSGKTHKEKGLQHSLNCLLVAPFVHIRAPVRRGARLWLTDGVSRPVGSVRRTYRRVRGTLARFCPQRRLFLDRSLKAGTFVAPPASRDAREVGSQEDRGPGVGRAGDEPQEDGGVLQHPESAIF